MRVLPITSLMTQNGRIVGIPVRLAILLIGEDTNVRHDVAHTTAIADIWRN